jgi:glycosyltransferase involved in cell wall biosynthesis
VGALRQGKGVFDLLYIAEMLKESHPHVTINIVGNGPQKRQLGREILKRRLDSVKMLGSLSHDELVSFYNRSKVFVFPTYYEGLPTTVLEAMACKLPVVASKVSGIPDLIDDGINGYTLPPGDIDGFHRKIAELLKYPEKQKQFGEIGRRKVEERFTWPHITQGIIEKYEELLSR